MDKPLKPSTKEQYRKKARSKIRKFQKKTGKNWLNHPEDLIEYLAERQEEWTRNTWNLYKSALLYYFDERGVSKKYRDILRNLDADDCKPSHRTKSQKRKHFPFEMLKKISENLDRETRVDKGLKQWLITGILTGIRPTEAEDLEYREHEGQLDLLVINTAKKRQASSDSEGDETDRRTLMLHELFEFERNKIKNFIEILSKVDDFDTFYHNCRHRLWSVTREIWPDRDVYPSLSSTRHQFAANVKARNWGRERIYVHLAAMLGHESDRTPAHYGYQRDGNTGGNDPSRVHPSLEDLKNTMEKYDDREHELQRQYEGNVMA